MKNRTGSKDRGWQGWVCSSDTACGISDGGLGGEYLTHTDASGREGLNLQDIWGKCSPGWGLEAGVFLAQEVSGEDRNRGWSRVRLRMVFSSFPFTCLWSLSSPLLFSFKGIPFLLVAQWFFFPLQLFLISQNHRVVCSSVSFYVPAFPFSVSLSVFICLLFPSVFLPWYIFLLQLFSNTCSALLILNFTNGSFYSYHFSA